MVEVEVQLLFRVGGWWDKTKLILFSTLVEVVVEVEVELGNSFQIVKIMLHKQTCLQMTSQYSISISLMISHLSHFYVNNSFQLIGQQEMIIFSIALCSSRLSHGGPTKCEDAFF